MESKYTIPADNDNASGEQLFDLTADSDDDNNHSASTTDEELPYGNSKISELERENEELRRKVATLEEESRKIKEKYQQRTRNQQHRSTTESRKRYAASQQSARHAKHRRPHASTSHNQSNQFNSQRSGNHNSSRTAAAVSTLCNTDKNRYYNSESAKTCHICQKKYASRIVSHYKRDHPESEVFVSRLSQKMVDRVLACANITVYEDQKSYPDPIVGSHCYFCDSPKLFQSYYWQRHYTTHTGEYMYECYECKKMVNSPLHCNTGTKRQKPFVHLRNDDLCGFLCIECNYLQLDEENMKDHQKYQHKHVERLSEQYKKIILIPSRKRVNSNDIIEGNFLLHISAY